MAVAKQKYEDKGVKISKAKVYVEDQVTVSYAGELLNQGAQNIYIHLGYGDQWEKNNTIPLEFDNGVVKGEIKTELPGNLNFCFKDSNGNWDNNGGVNYTIKITRKTGILNKIAEIAEPEVVKKKKSTTATSKTKSK